MSRRLAAALLVVLLSAAAAAIVLARRAQPGYPVSDIALTELDTRDAAHARLHSRRGHSLASIVNGRPSQLSEC